MPKESLKRLALLEGRAHALVEESTFPFCDEMLASIDGRGSVHQKTLNRLQRFSERFSALNFSGDREMERELEKARAELLSRSAEEYRGSGVAAVSLVSGLEKLRARARELATQDTSDLAANFGRMGQRRFALAS